MIVHARTGTLVEMFQELGFHVTIDSDPLSRPVGRDEERKKGFWSR